MKKLKTGETHPIRVRRRRSSLGIPLALVLAFSGTRAAAQNSAGVDLHVASDAFERNQLGPDWEVLLPANGQVQIVDNSDVGMIPGPQGFFVMNWRGSALGPDQFCEATYPRDATDGWAHMVYVRWRRSDSARYGFAYANDPNQAEFGSWILKYDGVPTSQARIIASVPAVDIPGPGDTIRIEIEGFTMRGYLNGKLVLTGTDTDPSRIVEGRAGMAARWATGNQPTSSVVKVWESWRGGDFVPKAPDVMTSGFVVPLVEAGAVRTKTRFAAPTQAGMPRTTAGLQHRPPGRIRRRHSGRVPSAARRGRSPRPRRMVLHDPDHFDGTRGVLLLDGEVVGVFLVRR